MTEAMDTPEDAHEERSNASLEAELRQSEKRYRTLFESLVEGFCIIQVLFDESSDPEESDAPVDFRFLETNPAFEAHTGLTDAEGKRMRALEPEIEQRWFEAYGRIARTGEPERFVGEAAQLSGGRWFDVHAFRVGEPREHKVAVCFYDITDRVEAIQQLRAERDFIDRVLETVGALIIVVEPDGHIVRFNTECEEVSGYPAEEAEGQNVFDLLIPPEDRAAVRNFIDEHRQGMEQSFHENHWETKEGERRLIRWSSTALRDQEGQIQNIIGTGIDITERRRLEREVLAATDEERRRIGQDLHDMLASKLSGTAMITRALAQRLDATEPDMADEIRKVVDLLNESGEQARALSHTLMPLEARGETLIDGLRRLAERQETATPEVTCSFEQDDEIEQGELAPQLIEEVASHLYRIAHEAVINAAQHADPNAIQIRLTVNDENLVVSVRDDGVGLPDELASTNGLGLHTMKYRATLIGAHLDIESAADGGTHVRCRLPLPQATGSATGPA